MKDHYLRLHLSSDIDLAYPSPVAWTCLEISGCSYWSTSTRISWSIPANTLATFYESEKCDAVGQFHFMSDIKDTSATFKFKTPQSFRSMMVSDASYPRPSIVYLDNCPSSNENGRLDNASSSFNWTDFNSSTVGDTDITQTVDGLSSNWSDALHELLFKMVLAKLTVDFSGAYHLNYTTRGDFICLTFYNCPHWQKATSVSWQDLPTYKFAMFYETDVCRAGGMFTAQSDYTTDGTVKFDSPKAIRSVMIGFLEFERRPSRITYACPVDEDEQHARLTGTVATATAASDVAYENGSTVDGGLSSNWYDVLSN